MSKTDKEKLDGLVAELEFMCQSYYNFPPEEVKTKKQLLAKIQDHIGDTLQFNEIKSKEEFDKMCTGSKVYNK
jgi:hypothetical protein